MRFKMLIGTLAHVETHAELRCTKDRIFTSENDCDSTCKYAYLNPPNKP